MGFAPPPDALPLQAQISLGIGVPPPASPFGPQLGLGGSGAGPSAGVGIGISVGIGIPDAPPLVAQFDASAAVAFQPTLPGILALCGFTLPGFSFSISFSISFILPIPDFFLLFGLSLNCDLANPIEGTVAFGGGRLPPLAPPELDAEFLAA